MKKYYLYIEPYTFIQSKNNTVLIYNSLSQSGETCSGNRLLSEIVNKLLSPNNKYCIKMDESQKKDDQVGNFIRILRKTFSGDLIETQHCKTKPFSLAPVVKIKKSIELIQKNNEFLEDNIYSSFQQLNLYLSGHCEYNCSYCNTAYKQFICCTKRGHEFSKEQVLAIVKSIERNKIKILNISGGNLLSYSLFDFFMHKISHLNVKVNIYVHYLHLLNNSDNLILLDNSKICCYILLDSSVDEKIIKEIIQKLEIEDLIFEFVFIITNEENFLSASRFCENLSINDWQAKPLFIKNNYNFFETCVFLKEEDILKTKLRKHEIFANQLLNTFDFGKLSIFSDKSVYANVNLPKLGLYNGDLTVFIYRELLAGKSWFRLRNNNICDECIFKLICPSPSNYELVIGKPNLCHVKP